jgi:hypothetical protein
LAALVLQRRPPLQRRQNRFQDAVDVPVDFGVDDPSDPVAPFAQELFPLRVAAALAVGRMSRAVDLDDELLLATGEVDEVGSNRFLPNEFESTEKASSQPPP